MRVGETERGDTDQPEQRATRGVGRKQRALLNGVEQQRRSGDRGQRGHERADTMSPSAGRKRDSSDQEGDENEPQDEEH